MAKLIGAFRVKNDAEFLKKTIPEACQYCDEIVAVDNWSDDNSIEVIIEACKANNTPIHLEKTEDARFHEGRDYNQILRNSHAIGADWIIQIDADEVYEYEFTSKIRKYMSMNFDVFFTGVTHMWTLDQDKEWYDVDTCRVGSEWSTMQHDDGTPIQHERPALFRVNKDHVTSNALRYHGSLCPSPLYKSNNCLFTGRVIAHYGYSTPALVKKKCERHGNIVQPRKEEIEDGVNRPPGWIPEGENLNFDAAVNMFKNEWMRTDNVELVKMIRKVWHGRDW